MFYGLRDQLYYSTNDGAVIFMDLRTGRYIGLNERSSKAFLSVVAGGGHVDSCPDPSLVPLIEGGYLRRTSEASGLGKVKSIPLPHGDLAYIEPDIAARFAPSWYLTFKATVWQLFALVALRIWSLEALMKALSSPAPAKPTASRTLENYPQKLGMAFAKTALLLGQADRCLDRSLAMFALLRRAGIACELVIGLRHRPFAAHSWVQSKGIVLNDRLENVLTFEPVAVLG
jgi:hypothetical protein